MREDGEYGFARGALDTPDGYTSEPETDVMRVTRHESSPATGRLVFQLKANRQDKGERKLEKRLAVAKQVIVGRFIVEIDGDGAVLPSPCRCCAHVSPPGHQVSSADETRWG